MSFSGIFVDLRRYGFISTQFLLGINDLKGFDLNDGDFCSEAQLHKAFLQESFGAFSEQLENGFFLFFFKFYGVRMDTWGSRIKFQYQQIIQPND